PNLDHLKKQAKDLLRELKQQDPAAMLTDAQHALARAYGFASWPKLRVHVESLAAPVGATELLSPFSGKWTANLVKSQPHPGNPFQRATLEIEVRGDKVSIVDVVFDELGREQRGENMLLADGVEHPSGNG